MTVLAAEPATLDEPTEVWQCGECGDLFSSSKRLNAHEKTHRSADCPHCEARVSASGLRLHIERCAAARNAQDATQADGTDWPCDQCDRTFSSFKSLRVHQTSHRRKPCKWCGEKFSIRGLDRHEVWCRDQPRTSGVHALLPAETWRARLEDFIERVEEVPADSVLVMGDRFGPAFLTQREALRRTIAVKGPTLVVAATVVCPELVAVTTIRDRRKEMTWDRSQTHQAEVELDQDFPVKTYSCDQCGHQSSTAHRARVHKAGHSLAPCYWCELEQPVGLLSQHERACEKRPQ